jgi:hypothetical protein
MPADEKNLQVSCSSAVKMTDKKFPYLKGGRTKKSPSRKRGNERDLAIGCWLSAVG